MNRTQAMKEARRLFGKNAAIRDNGKPTSEEMRKEASAKLPHIRARLAEAKGAERKEIRAELDAALGKALGYRYTVGCVQGACGFAWFAVRGQGDTWDAAFAKVEPLYKKLAA